MLHKKSYQKPELLVHGNVEQITQVLDGGIGDFLKVDKDKKPKLPKGGGSQPKSKGKKGKSDS